MSFPRLTFCIALLSVCALGHAAPAPIDLVNLQPVNAVADDDLGYDPADPMAALYIEPVAAPDRQLQRYRMNTDLVIQNTGTDYVRLDEMFAATSSYVPPFSLAGDNLLRLPELYLETPLGQADLRRPMLANGGFGVSGLKVEQRLEKSDTLPFGRGLEVITIAADAPANGTVGYVFAGMHQSLVGLPPTSVDDPMPFASNRGFVALYNANGEIQNHLKTQQDEVSALYDLGDGSILIAGRYENSNAKARSLLINRLRFAESDVDGNLVNNWYLESDGSFGADAGYSGTLVDFSHGSEPCDVVRATMITTAKSASLYVIAAELDCSGNLRAGVVVMDSDGQLHAPFGSGGTMVYAGPEQQGLVPVGVAEKQNLVWVIGGRSRGPSVAWVWLAAALGDGCGGSGSTDCEFALNALDPDSGELQSGPWFRPTPLSNAIATRPRDFALDNLGRPLMAGASFEYNLKFVAVHRFTNGGASDNSFGGSGWYIGSFDGHDAEARAVTPATDGGIVLSVLANQDIPPLGPMDSIGVQKIAADGLPVWISNPVAEEKLYTHNDVRTSLDYGNLYEKRLVGLPSAGLVEDWSGRFVLTGRIYSDELTNPCEQAAIDLGEPLLDSGPHCGGPFSIFMARHLDFGEPDSRRWIAPGAQRRVLVAEDRDLGPQPPSIFNLSLTFDGYDPFNIVRYTQVFANAVWNPISESYGSYRFPFAPSVLANEERFMVKAHTLDHHHRNSSSSRFAYDIHIERYTGSGWSRYVEQPVGGNAEHLAWMRPVRAVGPGKVVACRRSAPDTTPGAFDGSGANFVKVRHSHSFRDAAKREFISYLHFAQDTVPESICPDVNGADPDGEELPVPVELQGGEILGLVGSSGNSSAPHLHIHVTTDADNVKGPGAGSYPLLFHDVSLQSATGGPDETSYVVEGRAIAHGSLAYPTD